MACWLHLLAPTWFLHSITVSTTLTKCSMSFESCSQYSASCKGPNTNHGFRLSVLSPISIIRPSNVEIHPLSDSPHRHFEAQHKDHIPSPCYRYKKQTTYCSVVNVQPSFRRKGYDILSPFSVWAKLWSPPINILNAVRNWKFQLIRVSSFGAWIPNGTWTLPLPTQLLTHKSLVVELVLSCGGATWGVCSCCMHALCPSFPLVALVSRSSPFVPPPSPPLCLPSTLIPC